MSPQNSQTNIPSTGATPHSSSRLLALLGILAGVVIAALAVNYFAPKPSQPFPPLPPEKAPFSQPVPIVRPDLKGAISLSLPAGVANLSAGKEGLVEIHFDTLDTHITVVRAVLTYDPKQVAFMGLNAKGTSLPLEVNPPGALDTPGRIEIVRFIPGPGASGGTEGYAGKGLLTGIKVKPLNAGEVKLSIDTKESQFVPYMTAEKYVFTDVKDEAFTVK